MVEPIYKSHAPTTIHMREPMSLEIEIKKYESVYNSALSRNVELRQQLTKMQGNTYPFRTNEAVAAFVPNMQMPFGELVREMQERIKILKENTNALISENDDLEVAIDKSKRIAEQTRKALNNVHIPLCDCEKEVSKPYSYSGEPLRLRVRIVDLPEKVAALTTLGLVLNGNGFVSLVGGVAAYYLTSGLLK